MTIKKEDIENAYRRLEERWDAQGSCGSCGWSAALYEHRVDDWQIATALRNGGKLELSCRSDDVDDAWSHRGVEVYIGEEP